MRFSSLVLFHAVPFSSPHFCLLLRWQSGIRSFFTGWITAGSLVIHVLHFTFLTSEMVVHGWGTRTNGARFCESSFEILLTALLGSMLYHYPRL